jgi:signal transduction histidine kinase
MVDDFAAKVQQLESELHLAREREAAAHAEAADLREALAASEARETAVAEVLRIIAAYPTRVKDVRDKLVESAARLCDAPSAALQQLREEDQYFVGMAMYGSASTPSMDRPDLPASSATTPSMDPPDLPALPQQVTPSGSNPAILVSQNPLVIFSVTDSGIGMAEEQLGRLFEAFSQAEASTRNKYGGTGLGLAISHHFCRLMGGALTVESAYGRGSTFRVNLPVNVEATNDR